MNKDQIISEEERRKQKLAGILDEGGGYPLRQLAFKLMGNHCSLDFLGGIVEEELEKWDKTRLMTELLDATCNHNQMPMTTHKTIKQCVNEHLDIMDSEALRELINKLLAMENQEVST